MLGKSSSMKLFFALAFLFFFDSYVYSQDLSKPEQLFEKFWKEFNDNYALFEVKGVSWQDTYNAYRNKVNAKTSEQELVTIFKQMLDPLKDGHISIFQKDKRLYKGESNNNTFRTEFQGAEKEFWINVNNLLQQQGLPVPQPRGELVDGNFTKAVPPMYISHSNEIGYIRFTRFFNQLKGVMGSEADEMKDRAELTTLVDQAINEFKTCKGLIIDLRENGGGHSGYELAGRFMSDSALVNYKSTRANGQFSPLKEYWVRPSNRILFTKPVVILTSDRTASAAEDFTLALSKSSNTTIIGTATKGMFSDIYSFELPNKMEVSLSNQLYFDTDKKVLEDKGVRPTLEMKNTRKDLEAKTDAVLLKAFEVLQSKTN
jgi:carboxyl-terminal processing protease